MPILNLNNIYPDPYVDPDPYKDYVQFFLRCSADDVYIQDYSHTPKPIVIGQPVSPPRKKLFNSKHCIEFDQGQCFLKSTDVNLKFVNEFNSQIRVVIEGFFYLEDPVTDESCTIFSLGTASTIDAEIMRIDENRKLILFEYNTNIDILEEWVHIAIIKYNANNADLLINGVPTLNFNFSSAFYSLFEASDTYYLGHPFSGLTILRSLYISQFRITIGYAPSTARYYDFTATPSQPITFDPNDNAQTYYLPDITYSGMDKLYYGATEVQKLYKGSELLYPVPVDPSNGDPLWANVSLLLTGDDYIDKSSNPKTVIPSSASAIDANIKKYGTGSYNFTVDNSYLSVPNNSQLHTGGNITIDFWAYLTDYNAFGQFNGFSTVNASPRLLINATNVFYATSFVAHGGLALNTWHHIALVFNNGNLTFYVNGVDKGTVARTFIALTNTDLIVGAWYNAVTEGLCYIDSFRITNAVRYTSNFNPETDTYLAY